jgi:geranylgeranyl diphosphate synthase, type I
MTRKKGVVLVADLIKRAKNGRELAKQILCAEQTNYPKLFEPLEHYIAHWDEFTHSGLFSLACEAVGGNPEDVVRTQAAISMMTAAFDLHDDIIDKSTVKHNVPTVYGKFNAEITLLLGNAFLIEGLKLFADSVSMLPKERGNCAFNTFKNLFFEVGNAHALEVALKERKNVTPDEYIMITEMKAASIEADMSLGALFGGGGDIEVGILAKVGRILGILATLRDDLIDVFDIEELRQRILVQDLPLPILFAMQDQEAKGNILSILAKPKIKDSDVSELVEVTLKSKPVLLLRDKMQSLIEQGLTLTNSWPKKRVKRKIQSLFSFMLEDL